jgi:hypothetical protein
LNTGSEPMRDPDVCMVSRAQGGASRRPVASGPSGVGAEEVVDASLDLLPERRCHSLVKWFFDECKFDRAGRGSSLGRVWVGCTCRKQSFRQLTCSVCHDIFKDPAITPCSHSFCRGCILTAIQVRVRPLAGHATSIRPQCRKSNIPTRTQYSCFVQVTERCPLCRGVVSASSLRANLSLADLVRELRCACKYNRYGGFVCFVCLFVGPHKCAFRMRCGADAGRQSQTRGFVFIRASQVYELDSVVLGV